MKSSFGWTLYDPFIGSRLNETAKQNTHTHTHTLNIRRNNSSARFRVLFGLAWKNSVNLHSMAALKWIMNGDADKPLLIMTCLIHIQTSTQCHQYHTILRHKCAGKAIHEPFCLHSEVTFGCVSHSFVCLFFFPVTTEMMVWQVVISFRLSKIALTFLPFRLESKYHTSGDMAFGSVISMQMMFTFFGEMDAFRSTRFVI